MNGGRYKSYPEYKYSGFEWIGNIPAHWSTEKLKYLANVLPSNIDKKTRTEEKSVSLCNYTDVYYNDLIDVSIDFMKATATEEQIAKFTLRAGDTIITKDSEDPNDIAVPAYVPEDLDGIVCGYHLAMVRPFEKTCGAMIKRNFESGYARAYFATRSNGLTRYGLGSHSLGNAIFLKPPLKEAEAISNFLDHDTAKIDNLIEKQQHLIALLKEKRQAVISHAVTKGLNPDVPMKDSGVEWLGEVPEHWDVKPLSKATRRISVGLATSVTDFYRDNGTPIIRNQNIKEGYFDATDMLCLDITFANHEKSKIVCAGDVIIVRTGSNIGLACVVPKEFDRCHTFTTLIVSTKPELFNRYLTYCINSAYGKAEVGSLKFGFGKDNLNVEELKCLHVFIPNLEEQKTIVGFLDSKVLKFEELIGKANNAIELMQERRTALISAAVTGKIDVRNWQPPTEPQADKDTP